MPAEEYLIPLPGSEPRSIPGLRVLGPANPDEVLLVSVYVRRRKELPPKQDAKQAPGERHELSREEFAAQFGADPQDLALIAAFASHNNLTVQEINRGRRCVTLSGRLRAFDRAFGVSIVLCEVLGQVYRWHAGPIRVPAQLAGVIDTDTGGVFGLSNVPAVEPK